MTTFSAEPIQRRVKQLRHTVRSLSELTEEIDEMGVGVSSATCARILTGKYVPNVRTLILVCDALGISPRNTFRRD